MNRLLAAALAALSTSAFAGPTVFGLSLGDRVEAPECPFKLVGTSKLYDQFPKADCVEEARALSGYQVRVRTFVFTQSTAPAIVKNARAFLLERDDGVLIGVHFLTPGVDAQQLVLSQLTEKYGPPTTLDRHAVQNLSGAKFDAIDASWSGDVAVRFDGVSSKLTYGEVYIDLPEAAALRRSWFERDRAKEHKL